MSITTATAGIIALIGTLWAGKKALRTKLISTNSEALPPKGEEPSETFKAADAPIPHKEIKTTQA